MKDQYSERIAELTAEMQEVRAGAMDTETKRERLGQLQSEINRLTEARRTQQAQRTNGISPMEQRGRRY